ncbi:inosose dehydratase [Geobacillus stearothermophilus]|nr:inosose dehydratase [Geobacillus stearothermophilus]
MFKENKVKLGIAPIGWTNDDMPELGGRLHLSSVLVKWRSPVLLVVKSAINIPVIQRF